MPKKKKKPRGPGRPKGSTIPIERDRQKYAIAIWHGLTMSGARPNDAAHWALALTSKKPTLAAAIEDRLIVASTEIKFTASSLDAHVDALVRKARGFPLKESFWLRQSAMAIEQAARGLQTLQTPNGLALYYGAIDSLKYLGWHDVLDSLAKRVVNDLTRSNFPPFEGNLGRQGRAVLRKIAKKPQ
jgi:hypothetical protein